jgi:hypothetical protein
VVDAVAPIPVGAAGVIADGRGIAAALALGAAGSSLIRLSLSSATRAGIVTDGTVSVINGIIGGATGLAGIPAVIWCSLRGRLPMKGCRPTDVVFHVRWDDSAV